MSTSSWHSSILSPWIRAMVYVVDSPCALLKHHRADISTATLILSTLHKLSTSQKLDQNDEVDFFNTVEVIS